MPRRQQKLTLSELRVGIFIFAALLVTGFLILKYHAANRPSTWPVIGFGIVLPIVLAMLFVH